MTDITIFYPLSLALMLVGGILFITYTMLKIEKEKKLSTKD